MTEILLQEQPDVCLLTETQLRSNINEQINGYTLYNRKREEKLGGGVAILIRNDKKHCIACHISDRNIECIWISVRKSASPPFFIGTYYGKQETRTTTLEIEREMQLLKEEIMEMSNEGEILLIMDGNAKIGLLNEPISRNGRYLLQVIDETNLKVMNKSDKCIGKITRKNTKNDNEYSAIDFVLASENTETWIKDIKIDEDGLLKVKGKNETDHNSILVNVNIKGIDKLKPTTITNWNIKAGPDKWKKYEEQISMITPKATQIITDTNIDLKKRYKKWYSLLEDTARKTLGKTTRKAVKKVHESSNLKTLNKEKKALKKQIENERSLEEKTKQIEKYRRLQDKTRGEIHTEKAKIVQRKFENIIEDGSNNALWKEKKSLSRNPVLENAIIKDKDGIRQYNPADIKRHTANYYETLYKNKFFRFHPYHQEVKEKIQSFLQINEYDHADYNQLPTIEEVHQIIQEKKNGKSTTDIKNEMLKRPSETMTMFIYPLITTIWNEEVIPNEWNKGHITSLWKGKGDKEKLENHRGITTSSAIGTIIESLIDKRIASKVKFTQAQGGGKKKVSTFDHLFLTRGIIDIAIKQKRPVFLTFYDVSKAYDNANNEDMLTVLWERGLQGKSWRILHNLSKDLSAQVKTRFGPTQEFQMEIGGRQGSRLTGRMFSKMMDVLAEECQTDGVGINLSDNLTIASLLWVDDVLSLAEGVNDQKVMLERVDTFATKHKLKWGQSKCNIMRVGTHPNKPSNTTWTLGTMPIEETKSYKYLGDILSSNGKNKENIEARKKKTQFTTVNINSFGATEVLRKIETRILLELHDKITLPGLLTNAESWSLLKGEMDNMESIEIQALKHLFDLPIHIPTPAVMFSFGTIFTRYRIEKKRLIYLHKILKRRDTNWTNMMLQILTTLKIGWAKTIIQSLNDLNLPTDFQKIRCYSVNQWKIMVEQQIEIKNTQLLLEKCYKKENGVKQRKTKTAHIIDQITKEDYTRGLRNEYKACNRQETKTIMIARFRMLECGANFKGTMNEMCRQCKTIDDENHRLNYCKVYRSINLYDRTPKIAFEDVYSSDVQTMKQMIPHIERVWNIRNANGKMNHPY